MGVEDLTTDIHAVTHRTKLCTTWTRRRQRRHRRAVAALGTDAAAVSVLCGSSGDHYHVAETRVYLRCPAR